MNQILLWAAEEGGHEEERTGLDLVLPAPEELLWGAISFLVVAALLGKFVWPKIRDAIESREKQIQSDLESAENAKAEAQKSLEDYKRQVGDAKAEANRIIEEGRQQAEEVRKDLIAKAEKEAEGIVEKAREQIETERARTVQELQDTIAGLSIELAEKVVGRSLDASAQREMVDAYIKEVAGMRGNGSSR